MSKKKDSFGVLFVVLILIFIASAVTPVQKATRNVSATRLLGIAFWTILAAGVIVGIYYLVAVPLPK